MKRDWLNNVYKKASSKEVGRKMFARLNEIMSKCKDDAYVKSTISKFYVDFHNEEAFIDYLIGNWFNANIIHKYNHNKLNIFGYFFPLSSIYDFYFTFSFADM